MWQETEGDEDEGGVPFKSPWQQGGMGFFSLNVLTPSVTAAWKRFAVEIGGLTLARLVLLLLGAVPRVVHDVGDLLLLRSEHGTAAGGRRRESREA